MLDSKTTAMAVAIADDAAAMDLTAYCLAVENSGMTWRRLPDEGWHGEDATVARRAADFLERRLRLQRHPYEVNLVRLLPPKGDGTEESSPVEGADPPFDFEAHLRRQQRFSERTFGPGARSAGIIDHIRKELREIEADPTDVDEWVDVIILALDGAWRSGAAPRQIIDALVAKQTKNEGRTWPDWRTMASDKAIEHDRSHDAADALEKQRCS